MLVEVRNLNLYYEKREILNNLSLVLNKGEIIGIKGASGCGKSSLLSCIAKIIPTIISAKIDGDIYINNSSIYNLDIKDITKNIAMVRQNPENQIFFSTIEAEIAFGMENLLYSKEEMEKQMNFALDLINMQKFRYKNPKFLSGGQKQMLVLVSALVLNPKVLLLDEAFSQIDEKHKQEIFPIILDFVKKGGGVIMVDHQEENLKLCDKIYTLEDKKLILK